MSVVRKLLARLGIVVTFTRRPGRLLALNVYREPSRWHLGVVFSRPLDTGGKL